LALLVVAGCGPIADVVPRDATTGSPQPVSLRVAGVEGYDEVIADHRGKVVLVDFWATWCAPCVEQFAHTVELHKKYYDRGLAVVGVSLNEPAEAPQVHAFLAERGVQFDNLLSKYESAVRAIEAFDLPGPVPYYRLYDRA
jgi:thiol-disulfide isomerase/thioredoxin